MSNKGMTKVKAIQCQKCKDIIFSRAVHDYHSCTCGNVTIDGGFDYIHYWWERSVIKKPRIIQKYIKTTRAQLYNDWNCQIDKFGTIKEKK